MEAAAAAVPEPAAAAPAAAKAVAKVAEQKQRTSPGGAGERHVAVTGVAQNSQTDSSGSDRRAALHLQPATGTVVEKSGSGHPMRAFSLETDNQEPLHVQRPQQRRRRGSGGSSGSAASSRSGRSQQRISFATHNPQ